METLQIENEQLALEQEYEKYHWRDRISRKSGAECHYHNGSGHEGEEGLCVKLIAIRSMIQGN